MIRITFIFLAIIFIAGACDKSSDRSGIYQSEKSNFYNGKAWNWVQLDAGGNPMKVAFVLDDAVLNSVPLVGSNNSFELSKNLNVQSSSLPFFHTLVAWNPNGHDPLVIYGKPHFDFHFYMTNETERMAIPIYTADSIKFKNSPLAPYLAANYINPGGGVPMMGAHWIDVSSPEFNGSAFTQTFIYGTYNGKVIFYEPMITLDFIKATTTSFERSIPQPSKFQITGYFPTKMRLTRHDGITEVILDEFVSKQAS